MEALPPVTETSDQLLLLSLYLGQLIRTLSEIRHSIATTYVYTNIHIIMHWIQIPWNWPSLRKIPEICQQPSVSHQTRLLEQGLALNLFWLELSCFSMNGSELIWLSMNVEMFMILTFLFQPHPLLPFFRQKILQLVQPKVIMINLIRNSSF